MAAAPNPCPPYVTKHAAEQWHRRARGPDADVVDVATAWVDAEPIELPGHWGDLGDEARYHSDCQVVLCRRDTAITTVYDLTGTDAREAVRSAVEKQFDVNLPTDSWQ